MSVSSKASDTPRQAFNGAKHFKLGWYQLRTMTINPLAAPPAGSRSFATSPRLIQLAAFVDFELTKRHQPVLVSIDDKYFIQYNRAKGFNNETRSMADRVTVTAVSDGGWQSERKAGLNQLADESLYVLENYSDSGRDLYIQVCSERPGSYTRPDMMVISIGLDNSLCEYRESP